MSLSKTADPLLSSGSNPGRQENLPSDIDLLSFSLSKPSIVLQNVYCVTVEHS